MVTRFVLLSLLCIDFTALTTLACLSVRESRATTAIFTLMESVRDGKTVRRLAKRMRWLPAANLTDWRPRLRVMNAASSCPTLTRGGLPLAACAAPRAAAYVSRGVFFDLVWLRQGEWNVDPETFRSDPEGPSRQRRSPPARKRVLHGRRQRRSLSVGSGGLMRALRRG